MFLRRLQKFLRLKPGDQRLIAYALLLVAWARIALWVLPFSVIQRNLNVPARSRARTGGREAAYYIGAIDLAARCVPAATCLTRCLAAHVLLGRAGIASVIRFGARRNPAGAFEAHSWLESGGKIITAEQPGLGFLPLNLVSRE